MNIQAVVLRGLLHKGTWLSLHTLVTEDVITNADARKVLAIIKRLHGAIDGDISLISIELDIESTYKLNESLREALLEKVREMAEAPELAQDELDPVVRRFVAREKLMKAALHLSAHMEDEEFDYDELLSLCESSRECSVGFDPEITSYKLAGAPDVIKRSGIIPTNLSARLDKALDGGMASGELYVYLGPGGRGKTSAMVKTACGVARMGMNTLVVGLEIKADQYFGLIDKEITGLTKEELISAPFLALSKRDSLPGNVWVKDWSAGIDGKKATPADIRNLLIALKRQGKEVHLLVVDQWELLGTSAYFREDRQGYRENGVRLRMLGNEFNFPTLTGWQTNRSGYKTHLIEEEHIGEDISVMKTSDGIITLNQNKEERREKRMRLGLLKQRVGGGYPVVDCYWDIDRMEFRDRTDKDIEDNLSVEGVKDEKEQGTDQAGDGGGEEPKGNSPGGESPDGGGPAGGSGG